MLLPGGEILGTTNDWTKSVTAADKRYYQYKAEIGKPGVLRLRFQYLDQISEWIELWNASGEQLHEIAEKTGFQVAETVKFSSDQIIAYRLRVKE